MKASVDRKPVQCSGTPPVFHNDTADLGYGFNVMKGMIHAQEQRVSVLTVRQFA